MNDICRRYDDIILLLYDGAIWRKSKELEITDKIRTAHILSYTPKTNPIGQILKQIRSIGFKTVMKEE